MLRRGGGEYDSCASSVCLSPLQRSWIVHASFGIFLQAFIDSSLSLIMSLIHCWCCFVSRINSKWSLPTFCECLSEIQQREQTQVSKRLRSDYNLTLGAAINRSKSSSIKSADCILSASQRHHWHHQVHANRHQKQSIVQAASATVGHYSWYDHLAFWHAL